MNFAKKTKFPYMILVEGNVDVVTLHQYGFDNAVASLGTSLTEEQVTLLSRYTDEVVLTYDGDEAGQRAAKRAIPMLEKAGIKVRVLQMEGAKDPDEFLHKFGADKFRMLLEDSASRVEYQLRNIQSKYDLTDDDQRIAYIHEAAELISTLPSAAQREVYGARIAKIGKVSEDTVKMEIGKAYKRRLAREKKQQERENLTPVRTLQPTAKTVRYDNMKSAMSEECIIAFAIRDPSLLDQCGGLMGSDFSVPLLGRVFDQLFQRHKQALEVGLGVLVDLTSEEISHIASILHRHQSPPGEKAFSDCVAVVKSFSQAKQISSDDDLLAFRNKLKESKGAK